MSSIGSSRAQVAKLYSIARECGSSISSLNVAISNMDTYFTGGAATSCKAALERRINELNKIKTNAESIAARLNSAIAEIEEEERREREERAERARSSRSSSGGGNRSRGGGGSSGGPGMYL